MCSINFHKSTYHKEIQEQLKNPHTNDEKKYILKMLIIAIEGLYSYGINIYPNIMELFSKNGFKRSSLYIDAISNITKKITNDFNIDFKWINSRTFKKSNNREKNIIFCYLLFFYNEHFIKYLKEFLLQNQSNEDDVNNLLTKLQGLIEINQINNSHIQIFTNSDLNKNTNIIKEQKKPTRIHKVVNKLDNRTKEKTKESKNNEKEKTIENQQSEIKNILNDHENENFILNDFLNDDCTDSVENVAFENNGDYDDIEFGNNLDDNNKSDIFNYSF